MIRVLQCVNSMHRAGLETMLMNYYRAIDRTKIQFDFLMHRPERSDYDDEIEALGGRIYRAPRLYPWNYPAYFSYMEDFFRAHPEYRIVHSHIDAMSYLPLLAAKRAGVPVRIAHSHSTSIDFDYKYPIKQSFRLLLPAVTTHRLACGQRAGEYLFRDHGFQVLPNAMDGAGFRFNGETCGQKREALGLESKYVLGHVGRFCKAKNHSFLVDVFAEIVKRNENAVLMLVGTGEKEQEIRAKAQALGLAESVLFLGKRSDVDELYQAMDVFVMPSLYEGVPVVGIEAQFSGLPCVFSDRVPEEVAFTESCSFLPLKKTPGDWAEHILSIQAAGRERRPVTGESYDVRIACRKLVEYYQSVL